MAVAGADEGDSVLLRDGHADGGRVGVEREDDDGRTDDGFRPPNRMVHVGLSAVFSCDFDLL